MVGNKSDQYFRELDQSLKPEPNYSPDVGEITTITKMLAKDGKLPFNPWRGMDSWPQHETQLEFVVIDGDKIDDFIYKGVAILWRYA
jgi:hypothetical protein